MQTMRSKPIGLCLVLLLLFSIVIDTHRLDGSSSNNKSARSYEINDPYLIQRIQSLLTRAMNKRAHIVKELQLPDEVLMHRLALNRRPGLLRLKKRRSMTR
jgi:hypothetical protein